MAKVIPLPRAESQRALEVMRELAFERIDEKIHEVVAHVETIIYRLHEIRRSIRHPGISSIVNAYDDIVLDIKDVAQNGTLTQSDLDRYSLKLTVLNNFVLYVLESYMALADHPRRDQLMAKILADLLEQAHGAKALGR